MDENTSNLQQAKVIQVIKTVVLKGAGIESDPYRDVTMYWSLNGDLLAICDPCLITQQ